LVQPSATVLLDAQIAEKRAQELALKGLVILGNHGLPVLQIVIHQNQFYQCAGQHHKGKRERRVRVGVLRWIFARCKPHTKALQNNQKNPA